MSAPQLPPTTPEPNYAAAKPGLHLGVIAGFAVMALAIIGLAAALLVVITDGKSDGKGDGPDGAVEVETFTASGSLEVIGDLSFYSGEGCYGGGGFDDIQPGAQVVVRDNTGATVGIGQLDEGKVTYKGLSPETPISCQWDFVVEGIPTGSTSYAVEVTHRGEVAFTQDDAQTISLSLS